MVTQRLTIPSAIHEARDQPLVLGKGVKADLYRVEWDGAPLVVKTFTRKPPLLRWFGRYQIVREMRAYRRLEGIDGIPLLHEAPDPYTLVMEDVEGRRLTHVRLEAGPKRPVVAQLQALVTAVHERGVAHLDLRRRDNILVDADGGVHLIDFATAHVSRPGTLRHRLLFPLMRSIDRSAFLKWKRLLTPEDLTEREQRKLRRHRRLRRLWLFNRRELGPTDRRNLEEARRRKREERRGKLGGWFS